MENNNNTTRHDPNPDSTRPEEPELDLYTIPSHSSWFTWNDIHDTERQALKEFFEGSSISRTPKIYKEYRDFIINKYREDPSRRLTFTEVRKSLIGDVTLIHKVFLFLENWGLINFVAPTQPQKGTEEDGRVRVEDGAPNGIRVAATPNSLRPLSAPENRTGGGVGDVVDGGGGKFAPLASFSDVFGDLKWLGCGNCGDACNVECYEYNKGNFMICVKCFKSGNYGENKSMDDFTFRSGNSVSDGVVWTELETFALLESVSKHGDNWDLVAQDVQTKSKLDCILKLIELPFGKSLLEAVNGRAYSSGPSTNMSSTKSDAVPPSDEQANIKVEDQGQNLGLDGANENKQNEDTENEEPPLKKQRTTSICDVDSALMKQVALISSMAGPQITAAAAEAAVALLSDEMSCPKEIFDADFLERYHHEGDSETKESFSPSEAQEISSKKIDVPLPLRIKAAVATGLGAAAARAKLLAKQEEREIEHLVATIIEAQFKKMHSKIKHCEDAELLMEEEYAAIEDLKEYILSERINILQRTYGAAGRPKLQENSSIQSQNDSFR